MSKSEAIHRFKNYSRFQRTKDLNGFLNHIELCLDFSRHCFPLIFCTIKDLFRFNTQARKKETSVTNPETETLKTKTGLARVLYFTTGSSCDVTNKL